MTTTFSKDPNERLDYLVDFSRWLPDGDTIQSAVAEIATQQTDTGPASMVSLLTFAGSVATEVTTTTVRVWARDGTAGKTVVIVVRITTVQQRVKEHAFRLKIRNSA